MVHNSQSIHSCTIAALSVIPHFTNHAFDLSFVPRLHFVFVFITVQFIDFRQALQSVKINVRPDPGLQSNLSQPLLSGVELSTLFSSSLFIVENIGATTGACRTPLGTSSFDSEPWMSALAWFKQYVLILIPISFRSHYIVLFVRRVRLLTLTKSTCITSIFLYTWLVSPSNKDTELIWSDMFLINPCWYVLLPYHLCAYKLINNWLSLSWLHWWIYTSQDPLLCSFWACKHVSGINVLKQVTQGVSHHCLKLQTVKSWTLIRRGIQFLTHGTMTHMV